MESNVKTGSDSYLTNAIDEPDFDLLQTLIDAESRGSGLAAELREIFQNFDTKQAEENHVKVQSYLAEMKSEFEQILEDNDEDEQEDAYDFDFISEWHWKLFDSEFKPSNTLSETFQLIFDELSLSIESSGAFGNAELLEDCVGWENEMNHWGFLITPFIPRNVLKSTMMWNFDSNNYMSSFAVSPIMSRHLLHNLVNQILQTLPNSGFDWIGIALLTNANSDLELLDSLYRNGGDSISAGYCFLPTSGGQTVESEGVCGPLVGKSWFASIEVFDGWKKTELIGSLDEEQNPPVVLKNLVKVTSLYLATPQGLMESTRSELAKSVVFGNLLIAFRMISEFKFGRASIESEVNSDSSLIRSVLYWMPGMDPVKRESLLGKGLAFPEEVGRLLVQGWEENISLIF
jgi:hypothetical protein